VSDFIMPIETHILAERTVPRYTSYPTAPHFKPDIGAAVYAQWLAQLPRGAHLSLYLHVPFCR
jgi:oxygen-independent coproporphyrinogen-3 oxidase